MKIKDLSVASCNLDDIHRLGNRIVIIYQLSYHMQLGYTHFTSSDIFSTTKLLK